ncbi:hypothetical protein [Thermococcus barossii]|uniref:Uncharacterized protein n=1 Tax=Thermococcus barossii TaxID=54077 RepID=A0A2Z2MKI3_9EURY|nr:hypothetical protein [Thermococcus barossii]ASJ05262.1 hypothetical protein A3L01_07740 [Thermococcus barossii]
MKKTRTEKRPTKRASFLEAPSSSPLAMRRRFVSGRRIRSERTIEIPEPKEGFVPASPSTRK